MSSEIEQALLQMEQDIGDIDMGPDRSPAESEFLNWTQEFRDGNDAINYAVRNLTVLDDEQSRELDSYDRMEWDTWRTLWSPELSEEEISFLADVLAVRGPGWEEQALEILEPHISNPLLYHWSQSLWSSMFMAYTEGKSYADVVSELGELESVTEQDDIPIDMGGPDYRSMNNEELWSELTKRVMEYSHDVYGIGSYEVLEGLLQALDFRDVRHALHTMGLWRRLLFDGVRSEFLGTSWLRTRAISYLDKHPERE